jgi:selenobiotic family peptide radical SAM maturase
LPNFNLPESYISSNYFTIQWHITNKCDLNCKHCYDRSQRSPLTREQGIRILDDLTRFADKKHVSGHVCFTGGNPFLHPNFFDFYREATQRGLSTSILGNPVSRKKIQKLVDIQIPEYFQVSLEGLQAHNDCIRGDGNFISVIKFLGVLRDFDISSAVMLTLTKDNMDQILPLAESLRGHTDQFTFNRLSQVGEGAGLLLPNNRDYIQFLKKYLDEQNPILGLKDNLLNIELMKRGHDPFGGCTGFGCGAAFSFVAILPDGEVHACRKFPSSLGNILEESMMTIYESSAAEKYRRGCEACVSCKLKPVCGGCLAITHSTGEDIFVVKDPFCNFDG